MSIKKILTALFAGVVMVGAMTVSAMAAEISASTADDFYNAIKNAESGDVVNLTEDVEYELWNSIWNKDGVTINGNGNRVTVKDVFSNVNGDGLFLGATNLTINDLKVVLPEYTGGVKMPRLAIMKSGTLHNVTVTGGAFGVSVAGDVTIEKCTFENVNGFAVETESKPSSASLTITESIFDENAVILRGGNNTFTANKITSTKSNEGVNVLGDAVIIGNDFGESTLGIDSGVVVTVEENVINSVELTSWLVSSGNEPDYSAVSVETNTLSEEALEVLKTVDEDIVSVDPAVAVGGKTYYTFKAALEEADDGDTIVITDDIVLKETVEITKSITIDGSDYMVKGADGKAVFTVKPAAEAEETALAADTSVSLTLNSGTYEAVNANVVDIENAVLNIGGTAVLKSNKIVIEAVNSVLNISGGEIVGDDKGIYASDLSKGSGAINVSGGKIATVATAITSAKPYAPEITISGGEFSTSGAKAYIVDSEGVVTVNDGDFTTTGLRSSIIKNDAVTELYVTGGTFATADNVWIFNLHPLNADPAVNKVSEVTGGLYNKDVSEWAAEGYTVVMNTSGQYAVVDASLINENLKIDFAEAEENVDEGYIIYNVNVVADDSKIINRLNSVDLTFDFDSEDDMAYEVIAVKDITVTTNADFAHRYMFNFDGKDDVEDTLNTITVAQIKVTGYGAFSLAVDSTVTTNIANATTVVDNVVDTFVTTGEEGKGVLDISDKIENETINVPVRDLVINIAFPNEVKTDNGFEYQNMTVTISGGDLDEDINVVLGDGAVMPTLTTDVKPSAKVEVAATDKYVVTVTDALTINNSYTVTVEGAGYRTARYTVTMTEDKTLNFWNNVKDNAFNVEEGKDSSAKTVTYLAGDIVKDGTINVYDLSAVVSYFGEVQLVEDNKTTYAKYDLDRNGKIDSKDVAYVLASWGN